MFLVIFLANDAKQKLNTQSFLHKSSSGDHISAKRLPYAENKRF